MTYKSLHVATFSLRAPLPGIDDAMMVTIPRTYILYYREVTVTYTELFLKVVWFWNRTELLILRFFIFIKLYCHLMGYIIYLLNVMRSYSFMNKLST